MNIEKLAKHLKAFTLDEIEMIAECDCKTELEHLLNEGKIVFEQCMYRYVEKQETKTFKLSPRPKLKINKNILFKEIALDYLNSRKLTKDTLKGYKSQLKYNILPYFEQGLIRHNAYYGVKNSMCK